MAIFPSASMAGAASPAPRQQSSRPPKRRSGSLLLDAIPASYWLKGPQQADLIDNREYGSVANIARSMNISTRKNPPIMSAMAWKAAALLFCRRAADQARM
jgi:hypothetical protein